MKDSYQVTKGNHKRILGDIHNQKAVSLVNKREKDYIYKPRSPKLTNAFEAFLLMMKQEGFPYIPQNEKIISFDENSYISEFIENREAKDLEEIREFYRVCGTVLFLSYLFGTTDLHIENLIASGPDLYLIDIETLLSGKDNTTISNKGKSLKGTVLDSHLLPNWIIDYDIPRDCSGISGQRDCSFNRLYYKGKLTNPYEYINEIEKGFSEAYVFAQNHQELIKCAMKEFNHCTVRVLIRPTYVYEKVIRYLRQFDNEQKAIIALDLLSKGYKRDLRQNRYDYMRYVCQEEVTAVINEEIPLFEVYGDGTDILCRGKVVADNFYSVSPVENAINRLENLNNIDLLDQRKIINLSMMATVPIDNETNVLPFKVNKELNSWYEFLEDGRIQLLSSGWMYLSYANNKYMFQSAGPGLYDGLLGILCAYAALYSKTQDIVILKKIFRLYQSYREISIEQNTKILLLPSNCSLQDGIAGQIQCLLHIYDLTGERMFYTDAVSLLSRVEIGDMYGGYDLLNGISGLSLCLPKIDKDVEEQGIVKKLAHEILNILQSNDVELTGAAHGKAGIALAYAALQSVLNINDYDNCIIQLLCEENKFYINTHNNWRDLRDMDGLHFMNGWCSGAPGIGMIRQRIKQYTNNKQIIDICDVDIKRVVEDLLSEKEARRDSLCCGNSARIIALSRLGCKNEQLYDRVINRFMTNNTNLYHPIQTKDQNYGLMQGYSGVIYAIAMHGDPRSGDMLL